MPLGIGAGGIAGIAFERLLAPTIAGTATTGGALTAGAYKYYVTAINDVGETNVSNEITVTTSSGNLTATITWSAITGATGYKVYRTAAAGASGTEQLVTTLGTVTSYADAAVGTPSGAFPTVNTASMAGTYAPPTKFFPFNSETVKSVQDTNWRRPIRHSADVIGAVPGNFHIEGDVVIEGLEDVALYFLMCSRATWVKSGSTNLTYTFTPTSDAVPVNTFSLTIQRVDGAVFGYTGCVVSSYKVTIDSGMLSITFSILGGDEASQDAPEGITWPTTTPFGAGMFSIEVPTGSPVTDTDTFEFDVDDAGTPQYRLKNTGRGAQFISYGERTTTYHLERDFVDRTDYDAFKAYTSQSITCTAARGMNNSISFLAPVAIKDTYEVNLSGQGDLVRAVIQYQNVIDEDGKAYQITLKTQEDV